MNKKVLKILIAFLLIMLYMSFIKSLPIFAVDEMVTWNVTNFNHLDGDLKEGQMVTNSTQRIMGTIINTIRIVGTGIAIIMITYVAIKYMSAAPTEKAEFKKSATAFIVGAVVLFASSQILGVIADFAAKNIT